MNYFKISRFFLYLAPFAVAVVSISTLFPFIVGKYTWFRTVIDLSLFFFLLGLLLSPEAREYKNRLKKWFKSPVAITVGIFAGIFVLSSFFAFDPHMAFWSNFERGEGGFQMLHFFLFFALLGVLLKEEKNWRMIFWLSIIAGFLMIFYGLGAGLKYVDAEIVQQPGAGSEPVWSGKGGVLFQLFRNFIGPSFKESGFRFQGSIGNPAYVGTYLIFMIFYAAYLFLSDKGKKLSARNIALMIFSAIFLIFLVFAGTRGAFVGLIVAIFFSIVFLIFIAKKWRRKLLILISCVFLLVVLSVIFKEAPLMKKIPALRILDISFSARTFQDRTFIWQTALIGFKERPILGWGPEGFSQVFDRHFPNQIFRPPTEGFGAWFDRAHNVFFDYLVETGILGLLAYLSVFLAFYFQLFKKSADNQEKIEKFYGREKITKSIFFALPIAYLVQGLVLFEVLVIYLNLFLFLSFMNYKLRQDLIDHSNKN